MAESARVTSIEAVQDFREALCTFCEKTRDALCAVEMEARRTADWLTYEAPAHWQRQLRERQEEVAQAQADLHRVKLQKSHGYNPDDIEQKEALARAKRRVEEAEEKIENVKRWGRVVERAFEEYLTRARRLADLVEGDPPPGVLFLDKVLNSLDAYLRVAPVSPRTAEPANRPAMGSARVVNATAAPAKPPDTPTQTPSVSEPKVGDEPKAHKEE